MCQTRNARLYRSLTPSLDIVVPSCFVTHQVQRQDYHVCPYAQASIKHSNTISLHFEPTFDVSLSSVRAARRLAICSARSAFQSTNSIPVLRSSPLIETAVLLVKDTPATSDALLPTPSTSAFSSWSAHRLTTPALLNATHFQNLTASAAKCSVPSISAKNTANPPATWISIFKPRHAFRTLNDLSITRYLMSGCARTRGRLQSASAVGRLTKYVTMCAARMAIRRTSQMLRRRRRVNDERRGCKRG